MTDVSNQTAVAEPAANAVEQNATAEPAAFVLPEAYKDKPWATKVKSMDDVYKQIDNLQGLVGKKSVPFDYSTATPEDIAAHHSSIAPKDLTAYEFANPDDPVAKAIGDAFRANGISGVQGKGIVAAIAPVLNQMEAERVSKIHDKAEYDAMSTGVFGDKAADAVAKVDKTIVDTVPKEIGAAFDEMPNKQRHAVDVLVSKIVSSHEAKVADMVKRYGIKETGAQAGATSGGTTDRAAQQKEIRAQIAALGVRPHTAQEKQALIDRLNETYRQ